jgi:hypothetical protein
MCLAPESGRPNQNEFQVEHAPNNACKQWKSFETPEHLSNILTSTVLKHRAHSNAKPLPKICTFPTMSECYRSTR